MLAKTSLRFALGTMALHAGAAMAAPTLDSPATAKVGSEISFTLSGVSNPRDFVTIVPKAQQEGGYQGYVYVEKGGTLKLVMPAVAGDYELRLLSASSPYPTQLKRAIKLEAVSATLDFPAQVAGGAKFHVTWTGPKNARDFVGIGDAKQKYGAYHYVSEGSPLTFQAPDQAGTYQVRYFLSVNDTVIAEKLLTVTGQSASVSVPASVGVGVNFKVPWNGPNNPRDFITVVKAGAPDRHYDAYAYTSAGNPAQLGAPDQAGDYEIRYLTGQTYATLASAKIAVTAASATVKGPATAVAGSTFPVNWAGPNNQRDFINIVPKGAREGDSGGWAYTSTGNPAQMQAPLNPGEYELRYSLGQSYATLARTSIQITQGKEEPGFVVVTPPAAASSDNAVEIIFDASGSMLQKIGGKRRIEIARETLTRMTSQIIPAGTPFAMRVFGREVNSCQTDLFIPVSPLSAGTVAGQIAKLDAKNGARTPIGASLAKVAEDLGGVKGERLVILLTDGEETCEGNPGAEIEKLQKNGLAVRVSIVGFAIDEPNLAVTFRQWAKAGNGGFFEANDAAGLSNALALAMRPGFDVVDAKGRVVAEGVTGPDKVKVMPGNYTVRLKGQNTTPKTVAVKQKETTTVGF